MPPVPRIFVIPAALLLVAGSHLAAQQPVPADSVPLYAGLGNYSRTVTTTSDTAQLYFNQGLRLTFGFGHSEGIRAFREATRRDPACALCWWGLAWASGPYINARMDSTNGVRAYEAAQRALALKEGATPVERALIEAMGVRYVEVPTRTNRAALDTAYAAAMRDVVRRFPNDLDAASLLGEAIMVLSPWDHWTRAGDPKPGTAEVLRVLESVLARNMRHPGACHHYIHATEASRAPERAAACADLLGEIIPGASHIPHMPSHTYMRIGRYGDAVHANQKAWYADQQAEYGGAMSIYPSHNLHMLLTSAIMDGQSAVAMQAGRDLWRSYPSHAFYPFVALTRFGRWTEVLELPMPVSNRFHIGVAHFGRGMGFLGTGHADSARVHLDSLEALLEATAATDRFRGHPQRSLLGIARAILGGELAASQGRHDDAIRMLRAALPLEDSLTYDEPEPWPIPVRHVLGAVLLEAGQAEEAEAVYREELAVHPNNGWSLLGLHQSLAAQGRAPAAGEARRRFEESWKRADVFIPGSRFAPRRGHAHGVH
jgi:tetratricopeptide (TPR) repeat protein